MSKSLLNIIEGDWEIEGHPIHNPSVYEIGQVFKEEDKFFFGLKIFCTPTKEILKSNGSVQASSVQLFMSLLQPELKILTLEQIECVLNIFKITFPTYKVAFSQEEIILSDTENKKYLILRDNSFQELQSIFNEMFKYDIFGKQTGEYRPKDAAAQAIADKLAERHKKLAAINEKEKKGGIIDNYISILSEEYGIPPKLLSKNITLYNLFIQFRRLEMRVSWETDMNFRLVGGGSKENPPDMWLSLI